MFSVISTLHFSLLIDKGGMGAGKGVIKVMEGGVVYNNTDYMNKNFFFYSNLWALMRLLSISIIKLGSMVFIKDLTFLKQKMECMA